MGFGMLAIAFFIVASPRSAVSLSVKNITGECRAEYNKWKKRGGYGAFAISRNGACGLSWDNQTLPEARNGAISTCRKYAKKSKCEVVAETKSLGKVATTRKYCAEKNGKEGLEACESVIKSDPKAAYAYNNRGVYYEETGALDRALKDFEKAVSLKDSNKENVALHKKNLARIKERIAHEKDRLAKIPKIANVELCIKALKSDKSNWDDSELYLEYVIEAKRRHLEVEDCQRTTSTASLHQAVNPSNLDSLDLCRRALDGSNTSKWGTGERYLAFVLEATRRQLSIDDCRKSIGLAKLRPPTDFGSLGSYALCIATLNSSRVVWDDIAAADLIVEVQRRSLSVSDCLSTIRSGDPYAEQKRLHTIDKALLCSLAFGSGGTQWSLTDRNRLFFGEVLRRGLTSGECGRSGVVLSSLEGLSPPEKALLCGRALNVTREGWINWPTPSVSEVKRYGLSINDCRLALGLPSVPPSVDQSTPKQDNLAVIDGKNRKIALVIGNSAYRHSTPLANPSNDAEAMKALLRRIGFDVISGNDLDKRGTEEKIAEFVDKSEQADISLFYYAGHGIQVAGENFIVPVDARVEKSSAIDFELVNVSMVTNYMGGEKSVGIALLDACRDNPFARTLSRALGNRSNQVNAGLTQLKSDQGGLLVGFATAPGDVAADGIGMRNSPFTAALLKHLGTEDLEIELMMKRVKADVYDATEGKQQPWHNSALRTEVYLAGK